MSQKSFEVEEPLERVRGSLPKSIVGHLTSQLAATQNIHKDRAEEQEEEEEPEKISTRNAAMTLVGATIGAGIMALPGLPKRGGVVVTTLLCVAGAASTLEAGLVFSSALQAYNSQASEKQQLRTFEDFGRAGMGPMGARMVRTSLLLWFTGCSAGYTILMAQQLEGLVGNVLEYRIAVLLLFPILWFLAMRRDVGAIARLMPLATAGAVFSCVVIIVLSVCDASVWKTWPADDLKKHRVHSIWPPSFATPLTMASCTATLFGSFGVMGNVPSITAEMESPKDFPIAWVFAIFTCMFLFSALMLCGHYGYGNFVRDSIVESMMFSPRNATEAFALEPSQWTGERSFFLPQVMCICVILNLMLSYPLNMMCVFITIQTTPWGQRNAKVGSLQNYAMRTAFVAFTVVVALVMKKFGVVYALFASVCGPLQGVFFPLVFGRRIRESTGALPFSPVRKAYHLLIMLLGAFCIAFGFVDSLMGVAKLLSTPKNRAQ